MQLGIFAKTFVRPTLAETLAAVALHGFSCVQFNMACAGLESLPASIGPETCDLIRDEMLQRGLSMAAVSGTCNMIHPDPAVRRDGLQRLAVLAAAAPRLGTSVVTLCTGTRDPDNMWRRHRDNDTAAAWRDLISSMRTALGATAESGVTLALEPEAANVVDSATKARRVLDEIASPRLKVVLDAANLFQRDDLPRMGEVLQQAVELLGREIVLVHAKEWNLAGESRCSELGAGSLDFDCHLDLLLRAGYDGPLILHGMSEAQVRNSLAFVRHKLGRLEHVAGVS